MIEHFFGHSSFILFLLTGLFIFSGFAENNGPSARSAIQSVKENGVASSSSRQELGTLACQKKLESLIAKFLGVEASLTFGMGFATNSVLFFSLISFQF